MSQCYIEFRARPISQITELTADMMRHLHARQYLGKALVVCDSPLSTLRVARKQWLRLARLTQKKRSSTINADKILRLTYAITHMQHMQFTSRIPLKHPDANVFFASPSNHAIQPPQNCYTLYVAAQLDQPIFDDLVERLPKTCLIVDYTGQSLNTVHRLHPKKELEKKAADAWQDVLHFFARQDINFAHLTRHQFTHVGVMDDALDTLLGVSHEFLRVASEFQHTFELARPLKTPAEQQAQFNTMALLAYRVQALTPGLVGNNFLLSTYHEDETYFLHDITTDLVAGESVAKAASRHQEAGRMRLASALLLTSLHVPELSNPYLSSAVLSPSFIKNHPRKATG